MTAPVTNVGILIRSRSTGVPSTATAPGLASALFREDVEELRVQRAGQVGAVGVPRQDVERRRLVAHQLVVDPVVEDQVVGAHPGEHGAHLPAVMTPLRRERGRAKREQPRRGERADRRARRPKSSRVTANDMLCTRSSPVAARWLSSVVVMMPPAQKPIMLTSWLPVISRTASMASSTRARVGVEVPVGLLGGRVAPADQEHLQALADGVLDEAAARAQVEEVEAADRRRDDEQRPLRTPARWLGLVLDAARATSSRCDDRAGVTREVAAHLERVRVDLRRHPAVVPQVVDEVARARAPGCARRCRTRA